MRIKGKPCMCGTRGTWGTSIPSSQFCGEAKTIKKIIIKSLKNLKQTKKREETLSREEQVELSPCLS